MLLDNRPSLMAPILYITLKKRILRLMKHIILSFCVILLVGLSGPAMAADCFADYKAKQGNPLKLHYGVAKVNGQCSKSAASNELAQRLNAQGWTLLNIVSVFGSDGLAKRKKSAGSNYLRF